MTFFRNSSKNARFSKDGQEVKKMEQGSYFGELALLSSKPRAATITVVSKDATAGGERAFKLYYSNTVNNANSTRCKRIWASARPMQRGHVARNRQICGGDRQAESLIITISHLHKKQWDYHRHHHLYTTHQSLPNPTPHTHTNNYKDWSFIFTFFLFRDHQKNLQTKNTVSNFK